MTLLDFLVKLFARIAEHPEILNQPTWMRFPNDLVEDGVEDREPTIKLDGYNVYIESADATPSIATMEPAVWPDHKGFAVKRG